MTLDNWMVVDGIICSGARPNIILSHRIWLSDIQVIVTEVPARSIPWIWATSSEQFSIYRDLNTVPKWSPYPFTRFRFSSQAQRSTGSNTNALLDSFSGKQSLHIIPYRFPGLPGQSIMPSQTAISWKLWLNPHVRCSTLAAVVEAVAVCLLWTACKLRGASQYVVCGCKHNANECAAQVLWSVGPTPAAGEESRVVKITRSRNRCGIRLYVPN
jgi:hypothetical protein